MTNTMLDKIRAGRRAALASLNARLADGANVVSFYEGQFPVREPVAVFHTVRKAKQDALPRLLLTRRIAA